MAPDSSVFDRVYTAIKHGLREGQYAPGSRLDARLLADRNGASLTPVREALHRLGGESLLKLERHGQFMVPVVSIAELRWRYDVSGAILLAAIERIPWDEASSALFRLSSFKGDMDLADLTEALFKLIANATQLDDCQIDVERSNDRLRAFRRAEERLFPDLGAELETIHDSMVQRDRSHLAIHVGQFHRKRSLAAPALMEQRRS